jgi:hypothetical protein
MRALCIQIIQFAKIPWTLAGHTHTGNQLVACSQFHKTGNCGFTKKMLLF